MKKATSILLFLLIIAISFSQSSGTASTALHLRAAKNSHSASLSLIPQGTKLTFNNCSSNWCEVTYLGKTGYVSQGYISTKDAEPQEVKLGTTHAVSPVKYYTNTNGNEVQSPTKYDNGPPQGATAECYDGTYSFSQNRRGTCSHHGGVKRWL